jgi:periplasmic divalent cation tolerance protein
MIYIFWTCAHREEARKVIDELLEKRLIACASILPEVESFFRWKGKIERTLETKAILKSRPEHFEKIRSVILEKGSYEVPEIAALNAETVNPSYLQWVWDETS